MGNRGRNRNRGHNKVHSNPSQDGRSGQQQTAAAVAPQAAAPPETEDQKPNAGQAGARGEQHDRDSDKSILDQEMVNWTAAIGRWTRIVGVFTALLFIATVGSVVVLWKTDNTFNEQLTVMDGQLKEMKSTGRQTDDLIAINKKLADAAQVQADTTRDIVVHSDRNIETQLRAYLSIEQFVTTKLYTPEKVLGYDFRAIWKNVGQTPAKIIDTLIGRAWKDPNDDSPQVVFDEFPKRTASLAVTVGSTIGHPTGRMTVTIDEMASILNKTKRYFLLTKINYSDIFDASRINTEDACVEVQVVGDIYSVGLVNTSIISFISAPDCRVPEAKNN
jgi:hypothetical protein